MKKNLIIILAVVAVLLVGGGVFAAIYFMGDKEAEAPKATTQSALPIDEPAAFYINLDQIIQKSAIHDTLNDVNRSIIANVVTQELGDRQWAEYTKEILGDLNHSGIDTKTPIYCYFNYNGYDFEDMTMGFTLIAEVIDAREVDQFIEYISALTGEEIYVERDGDMRSINIDYTTRLSYNDERMVFVVANDEYALNTYINKAFVTPRADLTAYEKYDIACSAMLQPMYELLVKSLEMQIDDLLFQIEEYEAQREEYAIMGDDDYDYGWGIDWIEEEIAWCEQQIESTETSIATLEQVADNMNDNANVILGLAFENGEIVLEGVFNGYNADYGVVKKTSNNNLAYVDNGAMAVLNIGIDGERLSELLQNTLTPEYADMFGVDRNDFNIITGILFDAVESIDGDVMVALNDLYGGYNGIRSAEATIAADVNDDYIISAISQFGSDMLTPAGRDTYSLYYDGNTIKLGQKEDTFFATINMDFEKCAASAATAAWAQDVKNCYSYLVVNIDSLMHNNAIASMYRQELQYMDSQSATIIDNMIDAVSYAYIGADDPTSAKMVIVFDDRQTNSLEQIVNTVTPLFVAGVANNY